MRFLFAAGLSASLTASLLAACGGSPSSVTSDNTIGVPGVNASIAFETKGPLALAPGELATLTVTTSPGAPYRIHFRLVGESLDASLDAASLVADAEGRASLSLRAPNHAATFAVRASIEGGPSADLVVSVSEEGFTTLHVLPEYEGGRAVDAWVAFAVAGTTCAALSETLPAHDPEGALVNMAAVDQPLFLPGAPVGPTLAVVVRAERYAWGCTEVAGLTAGTIRDIEVHVTNTPLDTTAHALDASLEFAPEATAWSSLLTAHRSLMLQAFTSLGGEPKTLLDAMIAKAPYPTTFAQAAEEHGWLATLEAHYASLGTSPVAALSQWATVGASPAPLLRGHVDSLDATHARFTLRSLGPLDADSSGAPTEYVMNLTVDPHDEVHLGGTIYLMPSRYLGATLKEVALAETKAEDVVGALSTVAACDELELPGAPSCDDACIHSLCRAGIGALWSRALDASASANTPAQIPLKSSGKAQFDANAALTGFEGMWVGQVVAGPLTAKVSGKASATLADGPPPN